MKHIFSVRELYELREVKRSSPRVCVAQLFERENRFGIQDKTFEIWPVEFKIKTETLKSGDTIQFHGNWISEQFQIHTVIKHVSQIESVKHNGLNFDALTQRNRALERTKQFFSNRGFFYAETPTLVPSGGMESYLHAFQTQYRDYRGREWTFELPTSPEFALKKLIAKGIPKIFQIARAFRNHGELSAWHEPEFMMLEWYRVGATLNDILADTQSLVLTLAEFLKVAEMDLDPAIKSRNDIKSRDDMKQRADIIPKSWKTFHVRELFLDLLELNLAELQDTRIFYETSKHLSASLRETDTWDDIFCKLFMEKIEPFLKEQVACFVTGYPAQMSALAENEENSPLFVKRAETYLFGIEIGNGYQELVDSVEFEKRLQHVQRVKTEPLPRDVEFEKMMKSGLPPCAGNAVGIDRVIALLLGLDNIKTLFPIPFVSIESLP